MADPAKTPTPASAATPGKPAWTAPQLTAYGHVGKLTQGASGSMSETGGRRTMCL